MQTCLHCLPLTIAKLLGGLLVLGINLAYTDNHAHAHGLMPEDMAVHEPQAAVGEGKAQDNVTHAGNVGRVLEEMVKRSARVGFVLRGGIEGVVGPLLALATLVSGQDIE